MRKRNYKLFTLFMTALALIAIGTAIQFSIGIALIVTGIGLMALYTVLNRQYHAPKENMR